MSASTNTLPLPAPENKSNSNYTLVVGTASPYTTIAAACVAATALNPTFASPVTIEIRAGTYNEAIVLPAYTNLVGVDGRQAVQVVAPVDTSCVTIANSVSSYTIDGISFSASASALDGMTSMINLTNGADSLIVKNCRFTYTHVSNVAATTQACQCINVHAATDTIIDNCEFVITGVIDAVDAAANDSAITTTGGTLFVSRCDILVNTDSIGGNIYGIWTWGGTTMTVTDCRITLDGSVDAHEVATGNGIYISDDGGEDYNIITNTKIHVYASTNNYAIYRNSPVEDPGAIPPVPPSGPLLVSGCVLIVSTNNTVVVCINPADVGYNVVSGSALYATGGAIITNGRLFGCINANTGAILAPTGVDGISADIASVTSCDTVGGIVTAIAE
jgi:hypothetical protein